MTSKVAILSRVELYACVSNSAPLSAGVPSSDLETVLDQLTGRVVLTIPEAGAIVGLGRSASYVAARRGELPTLRFGGRLVVPTALLRRMLGLDVEGSSTP